MPPIKITASYLDFTDWGEPFPITIIARTRLNETAGETILKNVSETSADHDIYFCIEGLDQYVESHHDLPPDLAGKTPEEFQGIPITDWRMVELTNVCITNRDEFFWSDKNSLPRGDQSLECFDGFLIIATLRKSAKSKRVEVVRLISADPLTAQHFDQNTLAWIKNV